MKKIELSRREFLKGTGALIVSFNLFPPASLVYGQARAGLRPNLIRRNSILGSRSVQTAVSRFLPARLSSALASKPPWRKSPPKNWTCHGNASKWTWAIPPKRLTRQRRPAAARSNGRGRKFARQQLRLERSFFDWPRKSSARPPRN